MKKLSTQELKKIKGGFSIFVAFGIAALVSFIGGVISGYVHPESCGGE